jgi:hypothetical protein
MVSRRLGSLFVALGLLAACSNDSPGTLPRVEDELAAVGPGSGGAGGCASAADCPGGPCWQCNLTTNPGTCEPRTGEVCAPASSSVCDADDVCDASGACVPVFAPSGTLCGDQTNNACNGRDTCNGTGVCQDNLAAPGTICGSSVENDCNHQDTCDAAGRCLANNEPANTPCGDQATTTCTRPNTCDGSGVCLENHAPTSTPCNAGLVCTLGDHCANGVCLRGTPNHGLCGPTNCSDLGVPGCCATWYCDVNDTDPVSRGCKFQPLAAGSVVCRPSRSACDAPELCDGTEDCPDDAPRPMGYECAPALCTSSEARPAETCDGTTFFCPPQTSCEPYACSADGAACRTGCTTSAQCLDGFFCNTRTGRCEPQTPGGEACDDASTCATPYCVDGVCCDAPCEGTCEACDVRGREGVCAPIPGGEDPARYDNEPCDGDGSLCGGTCDGVTRESCAYPSRATECAPPACDAARNEGVEASFCDGGGACVVEEPVSCAPYACRGDACNGDCVVDADCDGTSFCRAGTCSPRRNDGVACSRAAQCASGFCVDGVCCESACDGQCEACGNGGTCGAVTGAPVGERPECAGSDACRGSCDGRRRDACAYPGREVHCRDAECVDGEALLGASCDGRGECPPLERMACPKGCEGFVCGGDECVVDGDCPSGRCAAGICAPRRGLGEACGRGGECASGRCVDGVCCESACGGQCEACDVPSNEGRCVAVPEGSAPHGARPVCASDGSACGGACDGVRTDGCAYPAGDVCREAGCRVSGGRAIATLEARCAGAGRCPPPEEQSCPASCTADASRCDGDCDADPSACPRDTVCSAGVCVEERPLGRSCSSGTQCASGFCADGVCCESSCSGRCEACDAAGSAGECVPIAGAPRSGRAACPGAGVCGATCGGVERERCVFPEGESCGPASCSNGAISEGATCTDEGECREARASACPAFSCNGNECSTACMADADCTGDRVCAGGLCGADPALDAVDRGSCGCRAPGRPISGAGVPLVLFALAAAFSRRRARRGQR